MKKVSVALIVIILFNFIFNNYIVYADPLTADDSTIKYSQDAYTQLTEEGKVTLENTQNLSVTTSTVGTIVGVFASVFAAPAIAVSTMISTVANLGGLYHTDSEFSADKIGWFTINSLVFGEYLLFNAKVYETNSSLNPSITPTSVSSIVDDLKNTVLGVYELLRLVAIALMLVMLILTGIYMGSATIAEDKVRAKEVLKAWGIRTCIYIVTSIHCNRN